MKKSSKHGGGSGGSLVTTLAGASLVQEVKVTEEVLLLLLVMGSLSNLFLSLLKRSKELHQQRKKFCFSCLYALKEKWRQSNVHS